MLFAKISIKSKKSREVIDGKTSIIINRGVINFEEMKKQRYNLDDLLIQLRNQSVKSIEEVDYAILETNGKLSVFKKSDDPNRLYPLPLIVDGIVDKDVLRQINKTEEWLSKEIIKENIKLDNIFYGFYKNNKLYIIENNKI